MTICHRTAAHRKSVSPGRRGAIAKPPFHSAAPMEVHGCLDKQACSYGANAGYAYDEFDGYIYDESLIGFDRETNLNYNYFRDYDPSTGRYVQSDPIGLAGGINTYTYVAGNPLTKTDPRGLDNPGMGPYGPSWNSDPCGCKDGPRLPDFISFSTSFTIPTPWTGTAISWSVSGSLDRFGNWYWSPIGPGAGRAPTVVSGSLTANWLVQKCKPTQTQLNDFLSGHGITGAAGFWGGGNLIYSPGNGYAAGLGIVSPQGGANYSYSFQGDGNAGFAW